MHDEDLHLEAALQRSDELVTASLRKEEEQRRSRSTRAKWIVAVVASFVVGSAAGAGACYWWVSRGGDPPGTLARKSAAGNSSTVPKSAPIVVTDEIPTEGRVEVKWGTRWLKANILQREGDIFFVKYDDWDDFFNEWVTPDRMRAIGSTRDIGYARPTPHGKKPGETRERGTEATTRP